MGKIYSDTEVIRSLVKQLRVFAREESDLLSAIKKGYASVGKEWSDLQYQKFRDALLQNDISVKKIVALSEEQIKILDRKLKQLENYLENDKATNKTFLNNSGSVIDAVLRRYEKDLKDYSEVPETLSNTKLSLGKLRILSGEDTATARAEFCKIKKQLRQEWEDMNGQPWPVYKHDIVNQYGEVVRKKGWKYDAHHIHPLAMGGSNTADNITPLSFSVHNDHLGIHAHNSAYNLLDRLLRKETHE